MVYTIKISKEKNVFMLQYLHKPIYMLTYIIFSNYINAYITDSNLREMLIF
jgi:hypothetical protein